MEAKYQGAISNIEKGKRRIQQERQQKATKEKEEKKSRSSRRGIKFRTTSKIKENPDPQRKIDEKTLSDAEDEKFADKEIPLLYRKFTKRYPFGNVHVALMFGPLMIENGVPK